MYSERRDSFYLLELPPCFKPKKLPHRHAQNCRVHQAQRIHVKNGKGPRSWRKDWEEWTCRLSLPLEVCQSEPDFWRGNCSETRNSTLQNCKKATPNMPLDIFSGATTHHSLVDQSYHAAGTSVFWRGSFDTQMLNQCEIMSQHLNDRILICHLMLFHLWARVAPWPCGTLSSQQMCDSLYATSVVHSMLYIIALHMSFIAIYLHIHFFGAWTPCLSTFKHLISTVFNATRLGGNIQGSTLLNPPQPTQDSNRTSWKAMVS